MAPRSSDTANIADLFWRRVEEDPDRAFVIEADDEQDWTYEHVSGAAQTLTGMLPDIGPIACMLDNSAALVVTCLASWGTAKSVALLNAGFSAVERDRALEDLDATVLITSRRLLDAHGSPPTDRCIVVEDVPELMDPLAAGQAARDDGSRPVTVTGDAVAAYIFTSGTTGRPKAASLAHGRLVDAATSMAASLKGVAGPYPLPPPSTPPNLVAAPLAQTGGLNAIIFALVVGRSLLLTRKFRPELVARLAPRYRLDTFIGTPTMLQMLATHPDPIDWPTLKSVISGGAPLTTATKRRFESRFNVLVSQVYGQTETGYIAGYSKEDLREGHTREGSVGKAYDGVEITIREDDGTRLPPGEVGEIVVRTPFSMAGYANSAETSSAKDAEGCRDGWVATGDLGCLDEDGYLYLVGRKTELILCGGFNVYPAEVEQALLTHPGVLDATVFGIPDDRLGEKPVAVAVTKEHLSEDQLIEHARSQVAHFKAPRAIRFVEELPRTESNKVLRRAVRDDWMHTDGTGLS